VALVEQMKVVSFDIDIIRSPAAQGCLVRPILQ
jgi:hypothetical protein